tara:strand:+ start:253 stop:1740 length:1488 start_codon:yes stop_codon:yes gene_type:complete
MTKKILFCLNADFTHFSIAYYLQQKLDCEFYALIDITNKPKKFFDSQQLVKFKKVWYFHDHIKKEKQIDTDYLQNLEEKYDVNLWNLIINERIFYRFFDFHKFTRTEMLSIVQQSSMLYEKIFDEVNFDFVVTEAPVSHHIELLTRMSSKLGINNLILSMPKLAGKAMITKQIDHFDEKNNFDNIETKNRTASELRNYLMKRLPDDAWKNYWEKQSQKNSSNFNSKLDYIKSPNEHEKTHYTYYGRTKLNVSIFTLKNSIKKYMRKKYIENNLESDVDTTMPYVYFPMSVDMERNLLIDSPMYTNQIEIIRIISKSLPVGYKLYVKENPAQSSREWRSKADYNEIKNIPNVTLIKPSVNGRKLIQNSSLVISIAGTSSLEAAFYEKPSIVFGKVIYNMLPSVQKVGNIQELPELIKKSLKIKVEISDLDKFLQLYENNTLSFDMIEFVNRFNHEFYYDAGLFDVNIDETKLNDFLIKQEDFFSDLISGYIKKINP